MKRTVFLSAAAVAVLAVLTIAAGCLTTAPTYIVSVDPALQPFSVLSETTGEPLGFDIDMMNWIAKDQGFNIKYEVTPHAAFLESAGKGLYDMRPGIIITDARKELFLFPDPYMESRYSVVCAKGSGITMEEFLNGDLIISVSEQSAYDTWLKNHFGMEKYSALCEAGKITFAKNVDRSVYAVMAGEADAVLCGDIVAAAQCEYYPPLEFLGYIDETISSGIAVPKSKPELIEMLNKGIANFRASAEYNTLKEKYGMPYTKKTYIVGVDYSNTPFTYLGEKGNLTGLDYDSIQWIAKKNGFEVDFTEFNWHDNINAIIRGKIDLWYSGMTITNERLTSVTFSTPYLNGQMAVLCRAETPVNKAVFDSGNAVIGVQSGTTNEDWVLYYFGRGQYDAMKAAGKIVLFSDQDAMYQALDGKTVDCVAVDEIGYRTLAREHGLSLVGLYPGGGDYGVAMPDGNIVLIDMINQGIREMKANGVYDELLKKYAIQ
ncbi:MAG: ABC transporter substrate-binding protein [Methanocorpusculum sp.]|nr:ABC transporter substrate-binding protein [Methanocorpusculum sp.]